MDSWIVFGLAAAIMFGSSAVVMKLAISNRFFGMDAGTVGVCSAIGMSAVFLIYYFLFDKTPFQNNPVGLGLGVLIGILWGIGNLVIFIALKNGAEISKMTPIYNTNTLIAVILGIILLHELPNQAQAIKVLVGAVFIVVGAILVSI